MNFKLLSFLVIALSIGFASCSDDDDTTTDTIDTLSLNLTGLDNLGAGFAYEGWIMVDGTPQTTGIFTVDDNGTLSQTDFDIENLDDATAFILTIEPSPDNDPAPSAVHLVAGDFNGNTADLSVGHGAALGNDFLDSQGGFIIATPTDSDDSNEESGIWFLDNSSGSPAPSLDLPVLPEGWAYEGWVVMNGVPVSTGTFTEATGADSGSLFSGSNPAPPYPGEDFLTSAPAGLSFPTSILGGAGVISIEPVPDNSPNPFTLKPLFKAIDANSTVHSYIELENNAANTNPTGNVIRG